MKTLKVLTRTPNSGGHAIAQIGTGKNAYKKSEISGNAATPEHIAPGQLSTALANRLQERGKGIADQQLIDMLQQVETARAGFQTAAILTGIALLAKKSSLQHGEWQGYIQKLFQNGSALPFWNGDASYRTIREYMALARRFLWKIETNGFLNESVESNKTRIACTANQVLDLVTAQSPEKQPLFAEINRFVAGRSLRRMLADFRQAEKDADDDAREEAAHTAKTAQHPSESATPTEQRPVQLLLWEQFATRKLPIIDAVFDEPGTEDLQGEDAIVHYTHIADALEERAKRARALAEAAREGRSRTRQ